MLEFIETPHGTIFPHACVCCTGTAGPMCDTHRELLGYGRVYVCLACVKRLARVLGLTRGKKADETAAALERLAAVERDLAAMTTVRDHLSGRLDVSEGNESTLREALAVANGRVEQLEGRLRDEAKAALELVN